MRDGAPLHQITAAATPGQVRPGTVKTASQELSELVLLDCPGGLGLIVRCGSSLVKTLGRVRSSAPLKAYLLVGRVGTALAFYHRAAVAAAERPSKYWPDQATGVLKLRIMEQIDPLRVLV
jgi:hypothetical protein